MQRKYKAILGGGSALKSQSTSGRADDNKKSQAIARLSEYDFS